MGKLYLDPNFLSGLNGLKGLFIEGRPFLLSRLDQASEAERCSAAAPHIPPVLARSTQLAPRLPASAVAHNAARPAGDQAAPTAPPRSTAGWPVHPFWSSESKIGQLCRLQPMVGKLSCKE